ncbi:MAG TPA: protoporphyrinogen oxidase [Acidobacteriota bacterium]
MKRLVVVGAGISGLAAAWEVAERSADSAEAIEVRVLERDREVGGKAKSISCDGWLVETGPTAFQGPDPAVDRLIHAAGLSPEVLAADPSAAHRFVVHGGKMREVQAHPLRFARAGILSLGGLLRLLAEPLVPPRRSQEDESVWEFARRRIGSQAADRLIAPMVLGVFAGDARRLSLGAAFPKLAALEREHGSLVLGMLAKRRERRRCKRPAMLGPIGPSTTLFSLRAGLQSLPRALARRGRFHVHCGVSAQALLPVAEGGWKVALSDGEQIAADAVILAGEAASSSELVHSGAPRLARLLAGIESPPVTVVALGYGPEALRHIEPGFGVLVPRGEGYRILGSLWDSFLFPGRSPVGHLLIRAMVGGSVDPAAAGLEDGELVTLVRSELGRMLGLTCEPVFQRIARWPRAIPQYQLGHPARLAQIEAELRALSGLFLAGNALYGIAFGKAAAIGLSCGERAACELAAPP